MFKFLKKIPIKQQILILTGTMCTIIFSILVFVTSYLSNQNALEQAINQLKVQTTLAEKMFEVSYSNLQIQGQKEVELIPLMLPNKISIDTQNTLTGKNADVPTLKSGDIILNNNNAYLEKIFKQTGNLSEIFVKKNDDFIRVSTLLKDNNNQYLFGTSLEKKVNKKALDALGKSEAISYIAFHDRHQFLETYKPILDDSKQVIGAIATYIDLKSQISLLQKTFENIVVGKTGYIFAFKELDEKPSLSEMKKDFLYTFHPKFQEKKASELKNPVMIENILTGISTHAKTDQVYLFDWLTFKDSQKDEVKQKVVCSLYISSWDWYIAVGSFVEEFTESNVKIRNIMIALSIISGLSTVILVYLFTSMALKPLGFITNKIAKVGEGDLTIQFFSKDGSQAETDLLALQINKTIRKIHDLTKNIIQSATHLEKNSEKIASSAHQIAESSHQQSNATHNVADSVEAISHSIQEIVNSASEASNITKQAKNSSNQGKIVVNNAIQEMNRIANQINDSATQIVALGEKSQKISNIIHVIKEIADQTNILALNAAIEAARAGDSGRGFAVVADEVRKLAERTTISTNEISNVITEVSSDTQNAVKVMEAINLNMQTGVQMTEQIGSVLEEINSITERTAIVVNNIVNATQHQTTLNNDITNNVLHVEKIVDNNAIITDNNQEASRQLMQLAQDLQKMVNIFKV